MKVQQAAPITQHPPAQARPRPPTACTHRQAELVARGLGGLRRRALLRRGEQLLLGLQALGAHRLAPRLRGGGAAAGESAGPCAKSGATGI